MGRYKLLIDTNVFIGLEDPKPVSRAAADLVRKCDEFDIDVFVHAASIEDIEQDTDLARKKVSLSKLAKFRQLPKAAPASKAVLEATFGTIRKRNDEVDVELLHTLKAGAVDFLLTEDNGIHARAVQAMLSDRVLTIADALAWIKRTFDPTEVHLPYVSEKVAHEIDREDAIFESLREGYPGFDDWWTKCIKAHRQCWVVTIGAQLAGLIVRKDETKLEAGTLLAGEKVLKICTFKVRPEFRGERLGELLLKQAIWYAQRNSYDVVYLTTFPDQETLIRVLEFFGFIKTFERPNGELVYEKALSRERLVPNEGHDLFDWDRMNYPRFVAQPDVGVFCVPIKGEYHRILFPEIAKLRALPLFPNQDAVEAERRTPGNTIRKVYLCRAKTKQLTPGSILLFYLSKDDSMEVSQCITTLGIVEQVRYVSTFDELLQITAKRSAYVDLQLREMIREDGDPLCVIEFLLIGHLDEAAPLDALVESGVFNNRPPQSICALEHPRWLPLLPLLKFGFEV